MIDACEGGARVIVETVKNIFKSPVGIFIYALSTAIVGIVILLAFLSLIVVPSNLPWTLPVLIGFNAAGGGYGVAEKWGTYPMKKLALFSFAVILTIAGGTIITLFCPWEQLLDMNRYLMSGVASLIFTFFGAWIAAKSQQLKHNL
ncbi:hypothetical protein [Desulfosediminicola ganghwensis]|uniref:hypothetical protein n=1 Tax=Desulfosediminicola ganghwensis TaxID=2569540 RepID=UPI0010AD9954|nr:hypothetical protein [Desulfosediminicola ganghwensis]